MIYAKRITLIYRKKSLAYSIILIDFYRLIDIYLIQINIFSSIFVSEGSNRLLQDPDVINHPTPNYDLLPICEREITIMRPDPETECINVHSDVSSSDFFYSFKEMSLATHV